MSDDPNQPTPPAPEELQVSSQTSSTPEAPDANTAGAATDGKPAKSTLRSRTATYKPNHKATFLGVGVVVGILALNVGILWYFINARAEQTEVDRENVTLSSSTLNSLGVSRNPVGTKGTELTIGPDTQFNGQVVIGGDVGIQGDLTLKNKFTAPEGSFTTLKAGKASLSQTSINGDATATNLIARKDLTVAGETRLQGAITMNKLVTINNNLNVSGNLSVGGSFTARSFSATNLTSTGTLTVGGHIITKGTVPYFNPGSALGTTGTASLSGTDTAGTINVTLGVGGGGNGSFGSVSFRNAFSGTPKVIVSPFNKSPGEFYVTRSSTGFTVWTSSSLSAGSYGFDYMVLD
ncbi:MAG TPA: hypothetical protein PL051_00775 [Candidatus Saccharibacteria bacterium]|nr:hypothetical protein [Candidatus Saccharibacteria bacterium]